MPALLAASACLLLSGGGHGVRVDWDIMPVIEFKSALFSSRQCDHALPPTRKTAVLGVVIGGLWWLILGEIMSVLEYLERPYCVDLGLVVLLTYHQLLPHTTHRSSEAVGMVHPFQQAPSAITVSTPACRLNRAQERN
jgi:hypothetical protein